MHGPFRGLNSKPILSLHRELDFHFPKFSISSTSRLELVLPRVIVWGDLPGQLGLNISKVSWQSGFGVVVESQCLLAITERRCPVSPYRRAVPSSLTLQVTICFSAFLPRYYTPTTTRHWGSQGNKSPFLPSGDR